ncbi:MAG: hypothetical protein IJ504_01845 [Bacteroidales bacterium]|nr:hypothetical protein [Bacteroidales bacterium]
MKKITKFLLASVAVLAVASCQKEMANEPEGSFETFTVTASIGTETKTVLDDDAKKIYWTPGDEISLFNKSGEEVVFNTDITEKSVSATFNNKTAFDAPDNLLAVYPTRTDKTTTYDASTNVINTLHIGGSQTAVAGSFDSRYAVAVGTETSEGKLSFKNVHSLIKFTIGGDAAPTTVKLQNNGHRMICGNFNYDLTNNTATVTDGEKFITLTGSFVVGETYYIAMTPGIVGGGVTLYFDDVPVKNTGSDKTLEPNKIYNLGTVRIPEAPALKATRLWVKPFAELGLSTNGARNCATDGEYVFVPNSANTPAAVKAFPVSGGDAIDVNMTGVEGGTHPTSCVRMIENNDPSINGGKDILVLSNLASSATLKLYVYTNGINSAPEVIELINTFRRLGDKFTYVGDWANGEFRFPDWNSNAAVVYFKRANSTFTGGTNDSGQVWPNATYSVPSFTGITEFVTYPDAAQSSYSLLTNTGFGYMLNNLAKDNWTTDPGLAKTFGYNFFEYKGAKYIAYAQLNANLKNGSLNVIADKGSAAEFKNTLEAQSKKLTAAVLDADSANTAGSSVCDCDIYVDAEGNAYAAVLIDNCGLAYFKLEVAD